MINNNNLPKISEKDRILSELYAVNSYYKNENQMNKLLEECNKKECACSIVFEGKTYEVSNKEQIKNIVVNNGILFNQNNLSLIPLGEKPVCKTYEGVFFEYVGYVSKLLFFVAGGCFLLGVLMLCCFQLAGFWVIGFSSVAFLVGYIPPYLKVRKIREQKEREHKLLSNWTNVENRNKGIMIERNKVLYDYYSDTLSALSQKFDAMKEVIKKRRVENLARIGAIQNSFREIKNNSIIPMYYLDDSNAVNKMLFLMLNKRADTIKELINLYEQETWQASILEKVEIINQSMIIQSKIMLEGLVKANANIERLVNDLENLEFTSYSYGYSYKVR